MKIYNLQFTIYNFKQKFLLSLGLFAIINFTLLIINSPVRAQEVSLSISPPLTEITIQPGKNFSQTFTVQNNGGPVVIVPKIFPFVPLDTDGHPDLLKTKHLLTLLMVGLVLTRTLTRLEKTEAMIL